MSYTTFAYSDLRLDAASIGFGQPLRISATVTNSGSRAGEETVQLYVRDLVRSTVRPVRELKGFQKVILNAGESRTVQFTLTSDNLRFYNQNMEFKAEPGAFQVFVGGSSTAELMGSFELK